MSDILYEGKSKIVCCGIDGNTLLIRYKDTATAFNGGKKEELSGKGKLNAEISNFLFAHLEKRGIKTHLVKVIDDTSAIVKKAEIVMVEVIVRNVAAGSFSKKYGVPEGASLKNVVVEFSYKSDELGDPMLAESHITALGLATSEELEEMARQALKINEMLIDIFAKARIRLVDFKLEFGRCGGEIILCDEISPDSCRLWDMDTDKKLDKDRFRRDLGDVLGGYREVLERLKGIRD
ncbi:MAG: phosphoribosylaminoimidazolesuccinocarboxamide synthase [Chitinispirillales bacterium]|jgi:phosphoribosylaminoimidazole-succinocarboxamide synthase|nr:phosphoribosylaminoimidazolesuccinocarboxamide synthase [Chitinispirillales bacterium]